MIKPLCLPLLCCLFLSACASDPYPLGQDVASRHPILVRDVSEILRIDIGPRISAEDQMRIAAFASAWRQDSPAQIQVRMPAQQRGAAEKLARAQLDRLRHHLLAEGVRGTLSLTRAPLALDERPAITLQFTRVKAEVATKCGTWPDDLASASSLNGWENGPYAELGCSYQTMMAVQTENPRDLTSMRAITPADGDMRARAIANARRGLSSSGAAN